MSAMKTVVFACGVAAVSVTVSGIEGIPLKNTADAGVNMPLCGLGTGGYGNGKYQNLGEYPECWTDMHPDASGNIPHPGIDCSKEVTNATLTWLQVGGRRIDNGDSYEDMHAVGDAIQASGVKRADLFLTTKIGDGGLGLGEEDTDAQVAYYLAQTRAEYIDLLLIHWPTSGKNSSEPICQPNGKVYNAKECRLITWRALIKNWKAGKAKAIGVSNFNMEHLQEIIDANLPLPSVNQIPVNPHLYAPQKELIAMCNTHNILVNSYSPLGIPDWKVYTVGNEHQRIKGVLITDTRIDPVAKKHSLTNAQTLLAWQAQLGMVYNPRSMSKAHMKDNLDPKVAATVLDADDLKALQSFEPDDCKHDGWYECCGGSQPSIPSCGKSD